METRTLQIEDRTYAILLPPPTVALPLCDRLIGLLGPVLGDGLGTATTGFGTVSTMAERVRALFGPAIVALTGALSKVDPVKVHELLMDSVEAAKLTFNNEPISTQFNFDKHFSQYKRDCYRVIVWVLWESVRDFFPLPGESILRVFKEAVASAFQSPTDGSQTTG